MTAERTEDALWAALAQVEDPEMPVNIVDLGLVVSLRFEQRPRPAGGDPEGVAVLQLTYTAMGCPAMDMISEDARAALLAVPDVQRAEIETVWSPPWTKSRISADGRLALQAWGLAV